MAKSRLASDFVIDVDTEGIESEKSIVHQREIDEIRGPVNHGNNDATQL